MSDDPDRMDRTAFFAGTREEVAAYQRAQMWAMSPQERLRITWELTRRVYGEDLSDRIPMDRTAFRARKHAR